MKAKTLQKLANKKVNTLLGFSLLWYMLCLFWIFGFTALTLEVPAMRSFYTKTFIDWLPLALLYFIWAISNFIFPFIGKRIQKWSWFGTMTIFIYFLILNTLVVPSFFHFTHSSKGNSKAYLAILLVLGIITVVGILSVFNVFKLSSLLQLSAVLFLVIILSILISIFVGGSGLEMAITIFTVIWLSCGIGITFKNIEIDQNALWQENYNFNSSALEGLDKSFTKQLKQNKDSAALKLSIFWSLELLIETVLILYYVAKIIYLIWSTFGD